MQIVQVFNLGSAGVNRDIPAHTLPPEVWSDVRNMRFSRKGAALIPGETDVFGTPTVAPGFVLPVSTAALTYWIYTSLTKAYVYEGGTHTNITRQTASVDVDYTAVASEDWNGTLLGGIPILNNGTDVPQYWPTLAPATKLTGLANWPSTLRAEVIRGFGGYLVAINITDSGTNYPHAIQWSSRADPGSVPGSWDITDPTVDAGRIELTDVQGGPLKEGLMLGNALILYKANSTHALRYVGGDEIFAPELLLSSSGILAPRCVCSIDKGTKHLVLTESDVIVHAGQKQSESVIDEKNRDWLFDNIDATNFAKSFCFDFPFRNEAWICFPVAGTSEVSLAAIYNYRFGTWSFRDFEAVHAEFGLIASTSTPTWDSVTGTWDASSDAWSDEGLRGILLANEADTKLQRLDVGTTLGGTTPVAYLERRDLAVIGRDRQGQPKVDFRVVKQIRRLTPKLIGSGVVKIQVGVADSFHDDPNWSAEYEFTIGTDHWVDFDPPMVGKLFSVRFSSASGQPWRLEGYDIELALLGNIGG